MKQLLQTLVLCFLLSVASYAQNFIQAGKTNHLQQINLNSAEVLEVKLPAHPSTGYAWHVTSNNSTIIKQTGNWEFVSDDPNHPIGATGTQIIRFTGVAPGITELELHYDRKWEQGSSPADIYKLKIVNAGQYTGTYKGEALVSDLTAPSGNIQQTSKTTSLPSSFSWLAQGKCTTVKNQGSCGSCWSFAACGSFEGVIKIFDNASRDLSEQWLVNCDQQSSGCNGGWCPDYMFVQNGAVYEPDQPYTQQDGACKSSYTYHEKPNAWHEIATNPTVAQIKQAIYDYGPVWSTVCVGNNFENYSSGVLTQSDGSQVNHAIVLVGWDDATSSWILRNSWGTSWGENSGYMRIKYGVSNIGYKTAYIDYKGIIPHSAAPLADFSASAAVSCTGSVNFTDNSTGVPTSWSWDFGDGQTSSQQNPSHTYANNGTYNVKLIAQNSIGSNTVTKNGIVTVSKMTAPATTGGSHAGAGVVNLSASGSGTLNWYTQSSGGSPVNTGTTYAPNLTSTTTFYVASENIPAAQNVGLSNNSAGGGYYTSNTDRRIFFDVQSPILIKSVVIYANTAGARDIEVVNSAGTTVANTTYTATAGMNTVPLNFNIPSGTNYAMKLGSNSANTDLFRNNAGVTYPYSVNGLVTITGSDASTTPENYYYYFYNWQIQAPGCSSTRTPVVGTITSTNGIVNANPNSSFNVYPNPNNGVFVMEGLEHDNLIEVFDVVGKQVYQGLSKNSSHSIDIKGKDKGMYFYRITNVLTKQVIQGRVVVY